MQCVQQLVYNWQTYAKSCLFNETFVKKIICFETCSFSSKCVFEWNYCRRHLQYANMWSCISVPAELLPFPYTYRTTTFSCFLPVAVRLLFVSRALKCC